MFRRPSTLASRLFTRQLCSSTARTWRVFLSGEIHSDWRERIADGVKEKKLPVTLTSPNTSHEDSDDCAAMILGAPLLLYSRTLSHYLSDHIIAFLAQEWRTSGPTGTGLAPP